MANVAFPNGLKLGQSISIAAPLSEKEVGLGCMESVSAAECWSFPAHSSSSTWEGALSVIAAAGEPLIEAGGREPSGIAFMSKPVEVVNWLMARSKNSALLLDSLNVHLYSSNFSLYPSASSFEPALTQRRPMKVPTSEKQYFEEEYQNDCKCSARRLRTKSMTVVSLVCAADRRIPIRLAFVS